MNRRPEPCGSWIGIPGRAGLVPGLDQVQRYGCTYCAANEKLFQNSEILFSESPYLEIGFDWPGRTRLFMSDLSDTPPPQILGGTKHLGGAAG
jgi:hypothetical protein